ncbi:MAG TPA: MupA/Atu3671 family FMN-dependent luciferase-like monooxygenase, partial [Ktedonobacteraceae bacterium]
MQRADILEQLKNYVALHLLDGDATGLSNTTPLLEWGIINSLAITRLLNFIQSQFHVTILLDQIVAEQFETLDALTDLILTASPSEEHSALTEQGAMPTLSPGQQRLWFLQQLEPTLTAYNEYVALRLLGTLDVPALEASLNECVCRQESLRTGFLVLEGRVTPTIAAWHPLEIAQVDLSEFSLLIREAQAIRLAEAQIKQPFQLEDAPLLRVSLFHIEHDDHLLLVVMHHIVTDGWSTGILLQELSSLYATYLHKAPASLPALQARYTDFSHWQQQHLQGEKLAELQRYWETQLADTSLVLDLPTDHPRPHAQTYRGAHIPFQLSPEITQALRLLSQRENVTQFMTLLAAFQVLLYRYSGQEDFVLGTPVANRSQAEFAPVIGFFVNMLVLRARFEEHMTFHDLLQQAREVVTGAMLHQEFPFEELVNLLLPERDLSRSPLFQVMFNVQERSWLETEFDELEVMAQDLERGSSKYDLSLMLVEGKDAWYGYIEYCTDLFTTETIERLIEHFRTLLGSIVSAPEQLLTHVPLLTPAEHQLLLEEWNKTASEYPMHACIHQLIEEQVTRSPQKEALLFEHQQLTYEELNQRANQLAHYLRRQGIGPDVAVGLCMERSLEMVISILGILKAGGAYVPLDPGYPRERLDFMLADAQIRLLITQRHLLEDFAQADERAWLCLDSDWPLISQEAQTNPPCTMRSDSLAYIMYTSGSTGSPHGVMVTHRNVVNFFTAMEQQLGEDEVGTWLAVTSISFDISVLELLWPLAHGFKVVVLPHQDGLPLLKGPAQPRKMDFSLFYFANNDETTAVDDKYRLLLEGAQFADQHGFVAVWTPERHFHPFGGLYPNPAVTGAAVAAITRQVEIRAGSVVLPLHHPVRVAEEWSVVDNLSRGRASISFATGWQANDFVLMPENYVRRKEIMVRDIETVRRLWRGETLTLENGLGKPTPTRIFPQPFQEELPVWITTGGSMETFKLAGELGANLLTHLLGQSIEELAEKIRVYRDAREKAGYAPAEGRVALMLHTFIGMD